MSPIYNIHFNNGNGIFREKIASIINRYNNTALFIAGDLNSRIKDMLDYIPNDDVGCIFDESVAYPSDNFEIPRKSKDKGCNKFGLSLIDLCCSYDLHVSNG